MICVFTPMLKMGAAQLWNLESPWRSLAPRRTCTARRDWPIILTAAIILVQAGAHGAFLSGAGPTVLAFAGGYAMESKASNITEKATEAALAEAQAVAAAMEAAAKAAGLEGRTIVTSSCDTGGAPERQTRGLRDGSGPIDAAWRQACSRMRPQGNPNPLNPER